MSDTMGADFDPREPESQVKAEDMFTLSDSGDSSVFRSPSPQLFLRALSLRNKDGRSLLHVATSSRNLEAVKKLSEADPSVSGINSVDEEGWAPLHSAASSGYTEIVEILISRGADVNLKNYGGRTALHYAASKGWMEIAVALISHNAKINAKDKIGCTPLHRAASAGNSAMCEYLIEEGAEVDGVDKAGQTPLMNAVTCHHKEAAHILIRHGADMDVAEKEDHA